MEVAFDSKVVVGDDGQVQFDSVWLQDRLDMCEFVVLFFGEEIG